MKKYLFVLTISLLGACNNRVSKNDHTIDSSYNATVDSLKVSKDSVANSVDSSINKGIDSIKKNF